MTRTPGWIAAECGPTRLRGWAMQGDTVLDTVAWPAGPATADRVADMAARWPSDVPVLVCGLDHPDIALVPVPARPLDQAPVPLTTASRRLSALPGLRQTAPPDLMRGPETRIGGFLTLNPGWDGVLCLPGPQTRWVRVSADEVVSFQTFMTGELMQAFANPDAEPDIGGNDFAQALGDAMSRPEKLAANLYSLRAAAELGMIPPAVTGSRLIGLLLGAELAAARPYWLGQQVAVIGGPLAPAYSAALELQGVPSICADGARMALAGLVTARQRRRG